MDEDPQNILKFKDEIYIIHEKRGKTLIGEAYRSEILIKKYKIHTKPPKGGFNLR